MVTLSLYPGQQPPGEDFQVVPAVFIVELLPTSNSLTAQTVSRSILVNYNSYSFEEFSETEEPPELAEITPNGKQYYFTLRFVHYHWLSL